MGPEKPLPISDAFAGPDEYVDSLLEFLTTDELLDRFCGGIHVLDFFTREPSLYDTAIPQEWREWFHDTQIMDILDFLMREDLSQFGDDQISGDFSWRGRPRPPQTLLDYVGTVRKHLLLRDFTPPDPEIKLTRPVALGMKVKKIHEVQHFAQYVDRLTDDIATSTGRPITHIVDFGSGQNYLGRALASEPYNRDIVAIETRPHNIEGAKTLDVLAKLVEKPKVMRNKKLWLMEQRGYRGGGRWNPKPTNGRSEPKGVECDDSEDGTGTSTLTDSLPDTPPPETKGSVTYINHWVVNGSLDPILPQICPDPSAPPSLLTISLHSCGNLLHHGLRTLTANPSVRAVALIGCCYNLMTERLGKGMTYKHPTLRAPDPTHRLEREASAKDEMGFPMSDRLCRYRYARLPSLPAGALGEDADADGAPSAEEEGIRLNITARMMAVQAPQNWTPTDSDAFFTRHFYRALLQRLFHDLGILDALRAAAASDPDAPAPIITPVSPAGGGAHAGPPIIIGGLRKPAYASFRAYVRGAQEKMAAMARTGGVADGALRQAAAEAAKAGAAAPERADLHPRTGRPTADAKYPAVPYAAIAEALAGVADEVIEGYQERYAARKHEMSVAWSLMAYSAGVVEAGIVVDRWLWLREQEGVEEAWVEPVFDFRMSPRNLCVVGVKGGRSER